MKAILPPLSLPSPISFASSSEVYCLPSTHRAIFIASLGIAERIFSASFVSADSISARLSSLFMRSSLISISSTLAYCESLFLYSATASRRYPSLSEPTVTIVTLAIFYLLILASLTRPSERASTSASTSSFMLYGEKEMRMDESASSLLLP